MKIAYFDCPSGASGDMILGALLDAGLDGGELRRLLETLPIERFRIETEPRSRSGIGGTGVKVVPEEKAKARGFPAIAEAIRASSIPDGAKENAVRVFRLLGEAEAAVHRIPLEKVHFHEVGAIDSIVDIVGAVTGLHLLGVGEVRSAVPPTGNGTVKAAHGTLPVPAPATLEILKGRPFRRTEIEGELLTPTGAALLVGLTESFGPPPPMILESVGYGIGDSEWKELPNVLRVCLGEAEKNLRTERVLLLETDVDDVAPEALGHLFEKALSRGALDLVVVQALMKKNRPGHRISLLAPPEKRDVLAALLMEETGTLGVRSVEVDRLALRREVVEKATRFGTVRFKRAILPGGRIRLSPEYEDCAAIAREKGLPFLEVWEAAVRDGEGEA